MKYLCAINHSLGNQTDLNESEKILSSIAPKKLSVLKFGCLYLNDREKNVIPAYTGIDVLCNSLFDSKDQKMDFPQLSTLERNH